MSDQPTPPQRYTVELREAKDGDRFLHSWGVMPYTAWREPVGAKRWVVVDEILPVSGPVVAQDARSGLGGCTTPHESPAALRVDWANWHRPWAHGGDTEIIVGLEPLWGQIPIRHNGMWKTVPAHNVTYRGKPLASPPRTWADWDDPALDALLREEAAIAWGAPRPGSHESNLPFEKTPLGHNGEDVESYRRARAWSLQGKEPQP